MCENCGYGGEGGCVYPYYGVAPHRHDLTRTGSIIGSTVIEPRGKWPANFAPDEPEEKDGGGCGVYTHCLTCGAPDRLLTEQARKPHKGDHMAKKKQDTSIIPPTPGEWTVLDPFQTDGKGWCVAANGVIIAAVKGDRLTEDRLLEVLKPFGELYTSEDAERFLCSANADPHEGADWLPYYKLALAMNAHTIGLLASALRRAARLVPLTRGAGFERIILAARQEFAASMVPCGIGPQTDPGAWYRTLDHAYRVAAGVDDALHGEKPREGGE